MYCIPQTYGIASCCNYWDIMVSVLNILIYEVIMKVRCNVNNLQYCTYQCCLLCTSDMYMLHWPEVPSGAGDKREVMRDTWRALEVRLAFTCWEEVTRDQFLCTWILQVELTLWNNFLTLSSSTLWHPAYYINPEKNKDSVVIGYSMSECLLAGATGWGASESDRSEQLLRATPGLPVRGLQCDPTPQPVWVPPFQQPQTTTSILQGQEYSVWGEMGMIFLTL